jgi:hypothetical protein
MAQDYAKLFLCRQLDMHIYYIYIHIYTANNSHTYIVNVNIYIHTLMTNWGQSNFLIHWALWNRFLDLLNETVLIQIIYQIVWFIYNENWHLKVILKG